MLIKEWSKFGYNPQLNLEFYQAVCVKRAFPLHMHDYYVICFVEQGLQSFTHHKVKHLTPPGGLIILNPGDDHTGEPADKNGFEYRALYPTLTHMQEAVFEITGKQEKLPLFLNVRIDDPELVKLIRALHLSLCNKASTIELESLFLTLLNQLVMKHAEIEVSLKPSRQEHRAVKQACDYIYDHATEKLTLTELANEIGFSRFYFLRVFRDEMGMPPHVYLESVRIVKAKKLMDNRLPLNQVATELGFSDQSHFTN
jgi:AraC-like DNA-binding protein